MPKLNRLRAIVRQEPSNLPSMTTRCSRYSLIDLCDVTAETRPMTAYVRGDARPWHQLTKRAFDWCRGQRRCLYDANIKTSTTHQTFFRRNLCWIHSDRTDYVGLIESWNSAEATPELTNFAIHRTVRRLSPCSSCNRVNWRQREPISVTICVRRIETISSPDLTMPSHCFVNRSAVRCLRTVRFGSWHLASGPSVPLLSARACGGRRLQTLRIFCWVVQFFFQRP
jgi:hypothetical protein